VGKHKQRKKEKVVPDQGEWRGSGSPYQMALGHWDCVAVTLCKTGRARTHLSRDAQEKVPWALRSLTAQLRGRGTQNISLSPFSCGIPWLDRWAVMCLNNKPSIYGVRINR
jgi:hypothetical protein